MAIMVCKESSAAEKNKHTPEGETYQQKEEMQMPEEPQSAEKEAKELQHGYQEKKSRVATLMVKEAKTTWTRQ